MAYTRTQLAILWYLKRNNPLVSVNPKPGRGGDSLITRIGQALDMTNSTVGYHLRQFERDCILVRTYKRGPQSTFGHDSEGYNPLIKVELVDPNIDLPPLPALPLAVVIAHENDDLQERIDAQTATEPSADEVIGTLIHMIEVDREQISKLQIIVDGLADENTELKKQIRQQSDRHSRVSAPMQTRVKDLVPQETWDALTHRK